jgi:mRNA interferase RelE/StbE
MLGNNLDDVRLDVKKMQGMSAYSLRVGQWRVIFERDDDVRIISIEKIGARGGIYK